MIKSPRGDYSPKNPGKRVHQNPGGNWFRNDLLQKNGKISSTHSVYQPLLWWFVALILISQLNCSNERKPHYHVVGTTPKTELKNLPSIHTSSMNEICDVLNWGESRTKNLTRPKMVLPTVGVHLGDLQISVCVATENETSKKNREFKIKLHKDFIKSN